MRYVIPLHDKKEIQPRDQESCQQLSNHPESNHVLGQYWFPIGNIGIGVTLVTYIGPILALQFVLAFLVDPYLANIGFLVVILALVLC